MIKGGDFSHWNPTIDWKQYVATKHDFVITKASDGLGSKDSACDNIRDGARRAGLPFIGYHFFRFGGHTPAEQAQLLFRSLGVLHAGEGVALDYEWDNYTLGKKYGDGKETDAAGNDLFYAFATEVEKLFHVTPFIYTGRSFMPKADPRFSRFPLWVFDYHAPAGAPKNIPPSWSSWALHQYTDHELTPGSGKIDMNVFNGDVAKLRSMLKQ